MSQVKEQALLAQVIDRFAEEFAEKAILRGGMALRVLGSARYTNDLDYVFAPYNSKKEIIEKILANLNQIANSQVSHSINSQCLRIFLTVEEATIQIEVKVAKKIKTAVASTKLYSPQYNLPKRLIHIVDQSISMSNKLAAWNERRLIRDLYDIWYFIEMRISPMKKTLIGRLKEPRYSKLVKERDYFNGKSVLDFYNFLRETIGDLTDKELANQLSDYLTPDELEGVIPLIRNSLIKLR